jgi:hypothetical protein
MKRVITFLALLLVVAGVLAPTPIHAGKVEDIVAEVKAACGKEIEREAAIRMVKALYVTCISGSMVDLENGCRIKCKKESGGGVFGE